MTYIVTDIQYDTDGEDIDLPESLDIDVPDDNDEELVDYLGDEISRVTGYCHEGFTFDKK